MKLTTLAAAGCGCYYPELLSCFAKLRPVPLGKLRSVVCYLMAGLAGVLVIARLKETLFTGLGI